MKLNYILTNIFKTELFEGISGFAAKKVIQAKTQS